MPWILDAINIIFVKGDVARGVMSRYARGSVCMSMAQPWRPPQAVKAGY